MRKASDPAPRGERKRGFHVAAENRRAGSASRHGPQGREGKAFRFPHCASSPSVVAGRVEHHSPHTDCRLNAGSAASWGNVAGNASPRAEPAPISPENVAPDAHATRKPRLLGRHRFGLRRCRTDGASICARGEWTGRQFASLESGQGGNLRRAEGAIWPLAGERRGVYSNARKPRPWTLPVVRKTDALPDWRPVKRKSCIPFFLSFLFRVLFRAGSILALPVIGAIVTRSVSEGPRGPRGSNGSSARGAIVTRSVSEDPR